MSDENNASESTNKVKCSAEDCDNFLNYEKFFKVPLGDDFRNALEAFRQDPTYENEQEIKRHACIWIITCQHESFKDSLWDTPRKTAEKEIYNLQFERDLKDLLEGGSKDLLETSLKGLLEQSLKDVFTEEQVSKDNDNDNDNNNDDDNDNN